MPAPEVETKAVDIRTPNGLCDSHVAYPKSACALPALLIFMDGIGVRPTLLGMIERFAAAGYFVVLPNMFYRHGRAPLFDPATILQPENRPRLMDLIRSLTPEAVVSDAGAFIDFIAAQKQSGPGKVGLVGYCMGGAMVMRTAAHYPDRIAAGAAFHAGNLAKDEPTSPHHLADKIRAELYFGHADQDQGMPPEQMARLAASLDAAGVRYRAELYEGALHGYTMSDLAVFSQAACDRHWDRALDLFQRTLQNPR